MLTHDFILRRDSFRTQEDPDAVTLFEGEVDPFHCRGLQEEESGSVAADLFVALFCQGEEIAVAVDVCDVDFSEAFVEFTRVDAEFEKFAGVGFGRWRHVAACGDHAADGRRVRVLRCIKTGVGCCWICRSCC